MRRAIYLFALTVSAIAQTPQPPSGLFTNQEVNQLCDRSTELMEAGGVAIPELQRAGAPLVENMKAACVQLRLRSGRGTPSYNALSNLKAYLALADAVPKPFPFPEAAQRQIAELRDASLRMDAHFRSLLDVNDRRLASADPANLARYAEANRKMSAPDPTKPRIVFFGDSITDYWRLNEYFPDSDYVNRGIAGQTTGEMLQRFKADVVDLKPTAVLILAGTNDLAREVPVSAIENNYEAIAELAAINKVKVIFASVLPVSDYHKSEDPAYERTPGRPPAFIKALNEWLQSYCSKYGYGYLDYFSAVVDEMGQLKADFSDDGLHPNAKGYRVMAPLASAAIQKLTGPVPEAPKPKRRLLPSLK